MEAQNSRILNLGSDSKDHLIHMPCHTLITWTTSWQIPFHFLLEHLQWWSFHSGPQPWAFSYKKDCCKELSLLFKFQSAQSLHLCCRIQTPVLFVLMFSSKRENSPSWLHSLPYMGHSWICTSWSTFPRSITLCIWHNLEMNKLKETHYINPSSKSHYSSHVAILLMAGCIYKLLFLPHPPQLTIPIRCSSIVAPTSA